MAANCSVPPPLAIATHANMPLRGLASLRISAREQQG